MNEQEMLQRQKIEKREKFDIVLAYILIVILLAAIVLILYLKFIKRETISTNETEYKPNYITLNDISTSLNSSLLANRYTNDNASFSSSVVGNALVVTYVKDDVSLNLNIPLVSNELEIVITSENSDIITDIYKEIGFIVCKFYGNDENGCRNTIDNVSEDNAINGIRYVKSENNSNVYIDITTKMVIDNTLVYNSETKVNAFDTDYKLNILDTEITNINVNVTDTNIIFTGNINNKSDSDTLSVMVKLYDANSNLLGENKYEFNSDNPLNGASTFEVEFMISDALKVDDIKEYSINVIR